MRGTGCAAQDLAAAPIVTVAADVVPCTAKSSHSLPARALATSAQTSPRAVSDRPGNVTPILHGVRTLSGNEQRIAISRTHLLALDSDRFHPPAADHLITCRIVLLATEGQSVASSTTFEDSAEAQQSAPANVLSHETLQVDLHLRSEQPSAGTTLAGLAAPVGSADSLGAVAYAPTAGEDQFACTHSLGFAFPGLDIEAVAEKLPRKTLSRSFLPPSTVSEQTYAAGPALSVAQLTAITQPDAIVYVRFPSVPIV